MGSWATEDEMAPILKDIRHAQWRWDYTVASHPAFFHAPEEVLRILGTSLEKAGNARIKLAKVLAKYGATDYISPTIDSKEKAQEIIGLPFDKLVEDKKKFRNGLLIEWKKEAEKKRSLQSWNYKRYWKIKLLITKAVLNSYKREEA